MYDLIIIGGGPAGLSAAMYGGRANLKTIVVERGLPGGQMQNTLEVENYPGIKSIVGPELSDQMHQHALQFGVEWHYGDASKVDLEGPVKKVFVGNETLEGKAVIVASGAQPRYLEVPGEKEFQGRGVSYCATCDGAFFKDKEVVVVGGGDSAVEEGAFLTRFAKKVTIIHRRDQLRAQPILQKRAFANEKISFIWDTVVEEISGSGKVTGVSLLNTKTQEKSEIQADGVFIYVGFLPNSQYLTGSPILNAGGYVETDSNMATKLPGVYAAGDVRNTNLRQIITAASDGAVAAMAVYHYLENQDE